MSMLCVIRLRKVNARSKKKKKNQTWCRTKVNGKERRSRKGKKTFRARFSTPYTTIRFDLPIEGGCGCADFRNMSSHEILPRGLQMVSAKQARIDYEVE